MKFKTFREGIDYLGRLCTTLVEPYSSDESRIERLIREGEAALQAQFPDDFDDIEEELERYIERQGERDWG